MRRPAPVGPSTSCSPRWLGCLRGFRQVPPWTSLTRSGEADVQVDDPEIWTIRAFPRSTRIWAIVFGSVTTSSFFRRYVVSIPAKGGTSSRTWTRTWSLSVGATGARLVSSARTTFIPEGFSFAGPTVDGAGAGTGSAPNAEPPRASVRDFLRKATRLSKRNRPWARGSGPHPTYA